MIAAAGSDRQILVSGEVKAKGSFLKNMRQIFETVDLDGSGEISQAEMKEKMQDGEVAAYFAALGVDAKQVSQLFRLLDQDNSGTITREEFLRGCLFLRGNAKSIDVAVLQSEIKLLQDSVDDVLEVVDPMMERAVSQKGPTKRCTQPALALSASHARLHKELAVLRVSSSQTLDLPSAPDLGPSAPTSP